MDGLELLILLVFILLSLAEGILGAKRKKKKRPEDRGEAGTEGEAGEEPPPWKADPEWSPEAEAREASRSDVLVPDDLWEEITGERREREPERGRFEEPEPVRERGGVGPSVEERRREIPDEADLPDPGTMARREIGGGEGQIAGFDYGEGAPGDASGEAVSLERLEIDSEVRHRRFHREYLPTTGRSARSWGARSPRADRIRTLGLDDPDDLRRAVLHREILGPPKALREEPR